MSGSEPCACRLPAGAAQRRRPRRLLSQPREREWVRSRCHFQGTEGLTDSVRGSSGANTSFHGTTCDSTGVCPARVKNNPRMGIKCRSASISRARRYLGVALFLGPGPHRNDAGRQFKSRSLVQSFGSRSNQHTAVAQRQRVYSRPGGWPEHNGKPCRKPLFSFISTRQKVCVNLARILSLRLIRLYSRYHA